jgi:hypothetical protein
MAAETIIERLWYNEHEDNDVHTTVNVATFVRKLHRNSFKQYGRGTPIEGAA